MKKYFLELVILRKQLEKICNYTQVFIYKQLFMLKNNCIELFGQALYNIIFGNDMVIPRFIFT